MDATQVVREFNTRLIEYTSDSPVADPLSRLRDLWLWYYVPRLRDLGEAAALPFANPAPRSIELGDTEVSRDFGADFDAGPSVLVSPALVDQTTPAPQGIPAMLIEVARYGFIAEYLNQSASLDERFVEAANNAGGGFPVGDIRRAGKRAAACRTWAESAQVVLSRFGADWLAFMPEPPQTPTPIRSTSWRR